MSDPGVSFIVPVHDGERLLPTVLAGIAAQHDGGPRELIAVDDRSRDGSRRLLAEAAARGELQLLDGEGRGAAAAINLAARAARYPLLCQIDQDVVLEAGWLAAMLRAVDGSRVAAVQGYYAAPRHGSLWARLAGLDVEMRVAALDGRGPTQIASGNTLYLAAAFAELGGFDESFGYGYDNDLAYRLRAAGWELRVAPAARSTHHGRPALGGYLRQQYGLGYGRLDLVAKHPRRLAGDTTSGIGMILHAAVMLAAIGCGALAVGLAIAGRTYAPAAIAALSITFALALERLYAGWRAWRRLGEPAALLFPALHLLRDAAWAAAIVFWAGRRLRRQGRQPAHSMDRPLYSARDRPHK